jgi:hypothetical protein
MDASFEVGKADRFGIRMDASFEVGKADRFGFRPIGPIDPVDLKEGIH